MNYHHFSIEERCCLREYYVKGKSYREIARLLGRNVSTVSRELRRNCTFFRDIPRYYPYTAQKKSNLRNSYRHRGMFWKQTVVSGKGKSKACFATLAERKTRYYIAVKIPDRTGETMAKVVISALSKFPKGTVKTITCDRGSEFACWKEIEKELNCDMYFADPYCAWQKGTNENLNGLLREFYPKGKNLSKVSPTTLKKNLALINARPKKVLLFQTPHDLFEQNLSLCCS